MFPVEAAPSALGKTFVICSLGYPLFIGLSPFRLVCFDYSIRFEIGQVPAGIKGKTGILREVPVFPFCGEKAQLLLHDHHSTGMRWIQAPVRGSCKGSFPVLHYMHGVRTKIRDSNQVRNLFSGSTPLKLSIFQEKGPADDLPPVLFRVIVPVRPDVSLRTGHSDTLSGTGPVPARIGPVSA